MGTLKVEILAWQTNAQDGFDPSEVSGGQYLPAKYNTRSELEITIEPGNGKTVRDFILTD